MNNQISLLPIPVGVVQPPAEADDGGWFMPFIPKPSPASMPAPKPKRSGLIALLDELDREDGRVPPSTGTSPEAGPAAPAAAADPGDAKTAPSSEIAGAPVDVPLPPPRYATASELVTWIKISLRAQTTINDDGAELIAYWVISTWFWRELTVRPCLVITGPAHQANRVLHVVKDLCLQAEIVSGFQRSHLEALSRICTSLIWEPNLDKRSAELLSNLTDSEFRFVKGGGLSRPLISTAIYLGQDPETYRIQNAIHIHLAPTTAQPAASPRRLWEMMHYLPVHLEQYQRRNRYDVAHGTWTPGGSFTEAATVTKKLGDCIVDAPELRLKLAALLKTWDTQRLMDMANTIEALVVAAAWTLSRNGREAAYAREIAAEVNRLLEARGERARLSPEKVGHILKKLGLRTRAISQSGHGLTFDTATLARINELTAMYTLDVMEDTPAGAENLHSQTTESNKLE